MKLRIKEEWNDDVAIIVDCNLKSKFRITEPKITLTENVKLEIYNRLKSFAKKHNTEPIDWSNKKQNKWYIYYSYDGKELRCLPLFSQKDMFQIYFTSEEICKQAIKEIGEDNIMKLFED